MRRNRVVALAAAVGLATAGLAACDPVPDPVVLVVNANHSAPDVNPGDGICATAGSFPRCTLVAAAQEAAASPVDVIDLGSVGGFWLDDPLVLDPMAPRLKVVGPAGGTAEFLATSSSVGPIFDIVGGQVDLERIAIRETEDWESTFGADVGVRVAPGATVSLTDVDIERPGSVGVDVEGSMVASRLRVEGGEGTGVAVADTGRAVLINSTIAGNDVGLDVDAGGVAGLVLSTVGDNASAALVGSGAVTASGSIVAAATGGTACATPVTSEGWNGLGAGCGLGTTDVTAPVNAVVRLGGTGAVPYAIADPASALIDLMAVGDGPCSAGQTDGRGVVRTGDGACNAGASDGRSPSGATSWVVDSAADAPDAQPGDGWCETAAGACTLRAAMTESSALNPFGPRAVVTIAPGIDPVIAPGAAAMLVGNARIVGNGATVELSGTPRLFSHCYGALRIEGLTVTGGGSNGFGSSAAIYVETSGRCFGTELAPTPADLLEIVDSEITGNADYGLAADWEEGVTLRVQNSVISDNGAGGAYDFRQAVFVDSAIVDNGGAAYSTGEQADSASFTRTLVSGNDGGVSVAYVSVTVTDSAIVDNGYSALAGDVSGFTVVRSLISGDSVGISAWVGGVNVTDSTVTGGETAIRASASWVSVLRSTLDASDAVVRLSGDEYDDASLEVAGSVLAGPGVACVGSGSVTSGGWNIAADSSCGLTATGDQQGVDALLGPLTDNGGPTATRLPGVGSPAIGAIPSGTARLCTGSLTDQRGMPRPQGGACDIGATEQ